VALDSPDGLIRSSDSPVVISFRPSEPLPEADLASLPGAVSVTHDGPRLVVTGNDDTVDAVMSLLARSDIRARGLRVVDATLDDAFLRITGDSTTAWGGS
jgi:ABC-2 type transport system ATP-binding protein